MKKKGNKKMPTPREKVIHNPIPTSFFILLVQSPEMFSLRRAHVGIMHAHAHAENLHVRARTRKWRRSVSAVEEPHDLP